MAQAELKIAGDSEKAQQSIVALEKKIDKLEGKLKGVSQRTRQAGSAAQSSFGGRAVSSVASYAAGFLSLTSAISAATQALQYHNQIKQAAAQKQRSSRAGLAQLSQLASTPEELQALVDEAHYAYSQGLGESVNDGGGIVFSLDSAGVKDARQRQMFIDLAANGIVADSAMFAESATTLQDAVGRQETGNYIDVVSKAFAASSASPSTADELLNAAAGAGGTATRLGISDEELLAAVATVASPAGGASEGGTQIDALFAAMEKQGGFQGLSLRESLQRIQGMGLEGGELLKYFGRKEGLAGFDSLVKNLDKFDRTVADIQQAQTESRVFERIALPGQVPELAAAKLAVAEERQLETARLDSGTIKNLRAAAMAEIVAAEEEQFGWFAGMMANVTDSVYSMNPLISDRAFLESPDVQTTLQDRDPKLLEDIRSVLRSIDSKTEKQGRTFKRNE